jgi:hypothetical protein
MRKGEKTSRRKFVKDSAAATSVALTMYTIGGLAIPRALASSGRVRAGRLVEFSRQSGQKRIWANYRRLRRGVIGSSRMEDRFKEDLRELSNMYRRGTFSDIELLFVDQSLEAVRELFEESLGSLEEIMRWVERKRLGDNTERFVRYISEHVKDDKTREAIINPIVSSGGVRLYLERLHKYLAVKGKDYSDLVWKIHNSGKAAIPEMVDKIEVNLDGLTEEELKEYWKKRLEEERKKYLGKPFFSSVEWELCQKYPEIARKLGVECPHDFLCFSLLCCIVIVVIVCWPSDAS